MKEKERIIVTGLVVLILILWLGFTFHSSPRFAGSLGGGMLAVAGSLLMLVPLLYLLVKRVKRLKKRITPHVSMKTLLAWHIYAGVLGPILVLLHTGHKFESSLGIALTAMMLLVVFSGFVGRYLMSRFSKEIREKKKMLATLKSAYAHAATGLGHDPGRLESIKSFSGFFSRWMATALFKRPAEVGNPSGSVQPVTMLRIVDSIADVEYAIKTHEKAKHWFSKWLKFHIFISFALYLLMILHIWGAIHFGLRWFKTSKSESQAYYQSITPPIPVPLLAGDDAKLNGQAFKAFNDHFERLFQDYWREPIFIHGIKTTVFDYSGIAAEVGQPDSTFSRLIVALQGVDPNRLGVGNRAKAFWINVYNFAAMKLAADHYPVGSITDSKISDGDPWAIPSIQVGNQWYRLNQIENEILLKSFDDPRIVFAVSCAAVSCPDRSAHILTEGQIDKQLDELVAGLFANPTKGLAIDRERKILKLSWIMKADRQLFGDGSDQSLVDFVRGYVSSETRDWIDTNRNDMALVFFEHDWTLNDAILELKAGEH